MHVREMKHLYKPHLYKPDDYIIVFVWKYRLLRHNRWVCDVGGWRAYEKHTVAHYKVMVHEETCILQDILSAMVTNPFMFIKGRDNDFTHDGSTISCLVHDLFHSLRMMKLETAGTKLFSKHGDLKKLHCATFTRKTLWCIQSKRLLRTIMRTDAHNNIWLSM